jgi:hypothetical protein
LDPAHHFPVVVRRRCCIISDSTNAIAPPVQYGVIPAGAQQSTDGVTPLEAGQTYDVNLFYWSGPGAQDGTFIGSQDFTP